MRFFDFLWIQPVKCDMLLSEQRSDIRQWFAVFVMSPQIRLTLHFGGSRSVVHGDFGRIFGNFANVNFWWVMIAISIGIVIIEFSVKTLRANNGIELDVDQFSCLFGVSCVWLSWCFIYFAKCNFDTVFTSRPHWSHGWRFTVRSQVAKQKRNVGVWYEQDLVQWSWKNRKLKISLNVDGWGPGPPWRRNEIHISVFCYLCYNDNIWNIFGFLSGCFLFGEI